MSNPRIKIDLKFTVEMSIYWEFPCVPWVPWDSHENGIRQASFMEMGMA